MKPLPIRIQVRHHIADCGVKQQPNNTRILISDIVHLPGPGASDHCQ